MVGFGVSTNVGEGSSRINEKVQNVAWRSCVL